MAIWGKTSGEESRPKSLPMDSNSSYSREFVTATSKGWVMQPGTASAATGNDNAAADPEILVAIRNLSVNFLSGNLLSVDYTTGAYADGATFDLVLTFDEEIAVTSAARTANQVVTNKVFILLDELGATDMVSDGTIACQYLSGTGSNTLTFRGVRSQTAAGYLAFADEFIHVNGTATLQSDSETFAGILAESGTSGITNIVLDASGGASGTTNGAVSDSTTITVDGLTGTLKAGDFIKFAGHDKVYTIVADATTSLTIEPVLQKPVVNNEVVTFNGVPFTVSFSTDNQNLSVGITQLINYRIKLIEVV